jgi:2-methylcitrate dehydratase
MSFIRELTWKNLEFTYRASVAYQFARYALALDYELLPQEVVHQAKRCVLDGLGCAIGGYQAPGRPMCEAVIRELGGPEEATVFGSGLRTSVLNATLANCFLLRFLDYNDFGGGNHNSDAIPSILAVSERQKKGGKEFLTSLVISYELGARVIASVAGGAAGWGEKGWTADSRGGFSMPPALGKLMGCNEDQIANAIGICGSRSYPLGVLDSNREENTMTKNLRFGWVTYDAILSCMLAQKGFTGPVRVVEGDSGLNQVILRGEMDLERLVDFSGWRILGTRFKSLCTNRTTHGHIHATLALVKEHDLRPEEIASVKIRVGLKESRHTTALPKKYPRNAESADHSTFYGNALAIKERHFGPSSAEPEKFTDPVVLDLIEKITVEHDPSLPDRGHQGISEITTKDGRRLIKHVVTPHGLDDDPLSDAELEEKFKEMATRQMSEKQIRKLIDTVWHLEKLDSMGDLAAQMVFQPRSRA